MMQTSIRSSTIKKEKHPRKIERSKRRKLLTRLNTKREKKAQLFSLT